MNTIVLLTTRVAIMMGYRWHYFPKDLIIFKIDPIVLTMFSCRGVFLVLISSLSELTWFEIQPLPVNNLGHLFLSCL